MYIHAINEIFCGLIIIIIIIISYIHIIYPFLVVVSQVSKAIQDGITSIVLFPAISEKVSTLRLFVIVSIAA